MVPKVCSDVSGFPPKLKAMLEAALAECNVNGLDAVVFETYRSDELAAYYYTEGRTLKPPAHPITNAKTAWQTWHHYWLAVDVISRSKGWNQPPSWWRAVADIFTKHGFKNGLDWKSPDPPHHQFAALRPSPSTRAVELLKSGGVEAVWKEVGII